MKTIAEQRMDRAAEDFAPYVAQGWRNVSDDAWELAFTPPTGGSAHVYFTPRLDVLMWHHSLSVARFNNVSECMISLREHLDRTVVDAALASMDVAEGRKPPQVHGELLDRVYEAAGTGPAQCPASRLIRGIEAAATFVRRAAREAGIRGWVDMEPEALVMELERLKRVSK